MRVDLDAKVRAHDGEELGSVQRAVVDPRSNEITDFVISTGGLFGHDVLVPAKEIEAARADGDAIRLGLTKREVEDLPAYVPTNYVAPPPGWTLPGAYAFGAYGGLVWPVGYAPVTAYPDPMLQQNETGRPSTDPPTIGKGAVVIDRDGEDVGVVDDVRFDAATGQLLGFVLRIGGVLRTLFGGGDSVVVDAQHVDRVAEGTVYLKLDKDELERATS